jgi:hypothetical protein
MIAFSVPGRFVPGTGPAANAKTTDLPIAVEQCWTSDIHAEPLPQTARMYSLQSRFVGVGTFRGFGSSFWNTPDGGTPASVDAYSNSMILTEILVDFNNELRGHVAGARLAIRGGEIGCSYMHFPDQPVLNTGQRYLFFGSGPFDPDGFYAMWAAWPLGPNDAATTPEEGELSMANLGQILRANPFHGDGGPVATAPPSEAPSTEAPDTLP